MKPEKYREMTREELERTVRDLKEELFNLRFRVSTQKLDNPLRLRYLKRDLARVLTVLREDELRKTILPGSEAMKPGEELKAEGRQEEVEDEGDRKKD